MAPFWNDWFPSDNLADRFARALASRHAVDMKEYSESFEFFSRARKKFTSEVIVDLCCGHGLTGILFALFERKVKSIHLVDKSRPKSFSAILEAAQEVAPWVEPKIQYFEMPMEKYVPPSNSSIMAIHACGIRTDRALEMAQKYRQPIAVMPCCYSPKKYANRFAVYDEYMPVELAMDIDRSYRMRDARFDVKWSMIPRAITPMNRIIFALPIETPER